MIVDESNATKTSNWLSVGNIQSVDDVRIICKRSGWKKGKEKSVR
jgi:hypothetical protein